MVGCGWEFAARTASPGQGSLQMTQWPLVSTGAPTSQPDWDLQIAASGRPSHAVLGGGLEPEVIPPKLPGWVLSPSPPPQSQRISLLVPLVTDAPPLCRLSWAMDWRTCISLATAWVRNWPRRLAGGWGPSGQDHR